MFPETEAGVVRAIPLHWLACLGNIADEFMKKLAITAFFAFCSPVSIGHAEEVSWLVPNIMTTAAHTLKLSPGNVALPKGYLSQRVKNEEDGTFKINNTIFRIPQRYVGYYAEKCQCSLALHFLLPDVTPIEPFSINTPGGPKNDHAAHVGILGPYDISMEPYLERLAAQGKLQTTNYGYDLQELPPETVPGPGQTGPAPTARGFLGVVDGRRVVIFCSDYRVGGVFLRCHYDFLLSDYTLHVDFPEAFLPEWRNILSALIRYASSHEER